MQFLYRLLAKPYYNLHIQTIPPSIQIADAQFDWEVTPEGRLEAVVMRVINQPLRLDHRGAILSTYPELETVAFRLSIYLANCLFKQTGIDALDPAQVLQATPELHAETPVEETELAHRLRTVGTSIRVAASFQGRFDPVDYPASYRYSAATALYADAMRVTSMFQAYELFYKVIEYFFHQNGQALDTAVSNYAQPFDPRFTSTQIEVLRQLRNRSVHPRANLGHVNPEDLEAVQQVQANLGLVRDLARLLLDHPTF